jgi:hypothetical protein
LAASNKLKTVICHCGRWRHVWDDDSFHDSSRSICYNVILKTLPIWPYVLSEDLFLLLYKKIFFFVNTRDCLWDVFAVNQHYL